MLLFLFVSISPKLLPKTVMREERTAVVWLFCEGVGVCSVNGEWLVWLSLILMWKERRFIISLSCSGLKPLIVVPPSRYLAMYVLCCDCLLWPYAAAYRRRLRTVCHLHLCMFVFRECILVRWIILMMCYSRVIDFFTKGFQDRILCQPV
jgi:hypothetical protein